MIKRVDKKNYKYKFSVVIPIYNVEDYLEETIESVLNQTIGFENNIQIILVNDGSPDNSEQICLKYKDKYPNNFIYIKQKNSGVSIARNEGLKYAEGLFTTMLDSDDKWSLDSFEIVYKEFLKHPSINIFSCKMVFFDAKNGNHPLNYKYKKNKVINIFEDYAYPQLSSSSIFVKTDIIKKYKYDPNIKFSEDNKFINEIIFDETKYMVLKEPIYLYRKRKTGLSAIQGQTMNEDWYLVTPEKVYKYLFELSQKKFGYIIKYIQNLVCYDLMWRIPKQKEFNNQKVIDKYSKILIDLIKNIDDDVIINSRYLNFKQCVFFLSKKNDKVYNDIIFKYNRVYIYGAMYKAKRLNVLIIDQIYIRNGKIVFFGKLDQKYISRKKFNVCLNNKKLKINYYELTNNINRETFDGEMLSDFIGISFTVDLNARYELLFMNNKGVISPNYKTGTFLCDELPRSYHHHQKVTIVNKNGKIVNQKRNIFKSVYYELKNDFYLLSKSKKKSVALRLFIKVYRLFKRKKMWFVSDRLNKADDNGEHFFEYICNNFKNENVYFVLNKKSVDYNRLSKIGKVIDYNSLKYKLLFGAADYVVSSHAENYIFNPMGASGKYIQDLYDFKYVFLQHGVIKDDLSAWLNVNDKKMDMFVTSCKPEYDSLLKCKYYYGKDVVKLTGLPRYDTLIKKQQNIKPENSIMISFTWRKSLSMPIDSKIGKRIYNDNFKESYYFKVLNNLINDKNLLKILEKYNYKIRFIPHPNVIDQLQDFEKNKYVDIIDNEFNYQDEFCRNKILVTDYSSVFFDFAYLNKPVIYFHFDEQDFYNGQIYDKGYFDFDKDGFGPLYCDYDKFISGLINIIEKGAIVEKKYADRKNEFFKYNDNKNCERVYNEIKKL